MTFDGPESPCSHCGTLELDAALEDLSELGPRLHSVCQTCADEILADEHCEACDCGPCVRRRFERLSEWKQRQAENELSGVRKMSWLVGLSEEDLT